VRGKPKPTGWDEVAAGVLLPALAESFQKTVLDPQAARLEELPKHLQNADAIWGQLQPEGVSFLSPQAKRVRVQRRLADWLALALHAQGFTPELRPGGTLTLRKGDQVVRPRPLLTQLVAGELTEARYLELCALWTAG
jgi:hypothetical protein